MKIFHVLGFLLSFSPIESVSVIKKDGGVKIFGHARDFRKYFSWKSKLFFFQNPFWSCLQFSFSWKWKIELDTFLASNQLSLWENLKNKQKFLLFLMAFLRNEFSKTFDDVFTMTSLSEIIHLYGQTIKFKF